ncbi:MAG: aminotransferase class I/II-fold pyridoxal phosphate-dependent enzyme [bacterium]
MTLQQNETLRRLPPYVFAELDRRKAVARARGATLIDLGIGNPDIPIAPAIIDAMTDALRERETHGYPPFRGTPRLFASIERYMHDRFGVEIDAPSEALALSGAKEGLAHLIMALCGPGDLALIPDIYYPVYARAVWLSGAEVRWVPMRASNGFVLDFDAIAPEDARRAKLIIMNYPNNPTGARVELEFYERAVAFAREYGVLLVSDLAYSEITFGGTPAPSVLQCDGALDVAVEFHSFSKTFSMAGLRIGFAVGNSDAIEALAAYRTNVGYGTPMSVQHAAAFALDHHADLVPPKTRAYQARRDAMTSAFASAGWNVPTPTASMYLWLNVPAGVDDWDWVQALIDEDDIVVTPGGAFGEGGQGFFRISLVREPDVLASAAARIAARHIAMSY